MRAKKTIYIIALVLMLMLSGCDLYRPPPTVDEIELPVPDFARDVVLQHLRVDYGKLVPPENASWTVEEITPTGVVGVSSFKYTADEWFVTVSFPNVAPEAVIYDVQVTGESIGLQWEGKIDALGQMFEVVETVAQGEPVDWRTYFREDLGYAVDVPENVDVLGNNQDETVQFSGPVLDDLPLGVEHWPMFSIDHNNTEFYRPPDGTDVFDWVTSNVTYDSIGPEISIAGVPAVHLINEQSPQTYGSDHYYFIREKDNQLFHIQILHGGGKQDWDIYNQFLESFAFVEESVDGLATYNDTDHLFQFQHPGTWRLKVLTDEGDPQQTHASAILLSNGSLRLEIQFKNLMESVLMDSTDLPTGDILARGSVPMMGGTVQKKVLVLESKDKMVFYGGLIQELLFHVRLYRDLAVDEDYSEIEIPVEAQAEVEEILASFNRTGVPLQSQPTIQQDVVAWAGHVTGTPPGFQFDDYLVLMPNGTGEVGLQGLTPDIEVEIASLRDKIGVGEVANFWGALVCPAMDYGGCQLLVSEVRFGQYQTQPELVNGWQGRVVCSTFNPSPSTTCGNAFVLSGEYSVRYGIWSQDPLVLERLETLRDTGAVIRIWGQILAGVPDVNGVQIQASQLDIVWAPATATPRPTRLPIIVASTAVPAPTPCNRISFVKDVTVPDGTSFEPGARFVKIWRIENSGTCTWTTDYRLVYFDGDRMEGDRSERLHRVVEPGQTVDVSVRLTAPNSEGNYRGQWKLQDKKGNQFGAGGSANTPLWVQIKVEETDTNLVYDFTRDFCAAIWKSDEGDLPCPGNEGDKDGFVILLEDPVLESRHEDEPALWTHPDEDNDGWIKGTYPEIWIDEDYRFQAWVGCLDDSEDCGVEFKLDYQIDGGEIKHLGSWKEQYDGDITTIELDLSDLEGEYVKFILRVDVDNEEPEDANAFWFAPRIKRP